VAECCKQEIYSELWLKHCKENDH